MNSRAFSIVATVLFVLALIGVIFLWTRNSKLKTSNEEYMTEVDSLTQVKYDLLKNLDSLQLAYEGMAFRSDSLSGSLAEAQEAISQLESIRQKSSTDLTSLRREINQLRGLKSNLESTIAELQQENQELRTRGDSLTTELTVSQSRNQELSVQTEQLQQANQSLLDETNRLKAESVKASGFQIDVVQRNDKPTTSGRRADQIRVSFDLTNVPSEFHGLHTVYLVISDSQSTPLQTANPISARINVRGEVAEFQAQQAKEINFTNSQRLEFKHDIQEKRLTSGYYRAAVYSDLGFLGSASFQVR